MASAEAFEDKLVETQSGADEVREFALRTSLFHSAQVIAPAPVAVSILGQLTLVATATDFKLVKPLEGFKHVRYPDSFRATIMQLANSGCLALNKSFANFDEINKRCDAVRPGVNNIIQLLVGHEDNTPHQNDLAIQRHLPNQITYLSKTVQACLNKAEETDAVFGQLFELTMEIHESCTATQGDNEGRVREADVRMAVMKEEQSAAEQVKRLTEMLEQSTREEQADRQRQFNTVANSAPSAGKLFMMGLGDVGIDLCSGLTKIVTFGASGSRRSSSSSSSSAHPAPSADVVAGLEPGYNEAAALRICADMLHILLTSRDDGKPDWNAVNSHEPDTPGCMAVRIRCEQVTTSIKRSRKYAGPATDAALGFAEKGVQFARQLESMAPPGDNAEIARLKGEVAAWQDDVIKFNSEADFKRGTSRLSPTPFLPPADHASGGSTAELYCRHWQYNLASQERQLNAARENHKAASEKLIDAHRNLGDILGQIAGLDVQRHNWEEIRAILRKAIDFLAELKKYLNNLVHFFKTVNNYVSVTFRETADQFVQLVRDATAMEVGRGNDMKRLGGVSLDAWTRQSIYNHALSMAKISRVVENISDMYVTIYKSSVHPGVNMLLGMGKLVGSNDQFAIAAAGEELQQWAQEASNSIKQLLTERMKANEVDIENRMRELEASLGGILPRSSRIEKIVDGAAALQAQETSEQMDSAVKQSPVLKRMTAAKAFV